jgi:hypothetical protein
MTAGDGQLQHRVRDEHREELPELDADVEAQEREWEVTLRQTYVLERAGETEPVNEPEQERNE